MASYPDHDKGTDKTNVPASHKSPAVHVPLSSTPTSANEKAGMGAVRGGDSAGKGK